MAVAVAVQSGASDAGLGIAAAARALGLDFVEIASERYELVFSAEAFDGAPAQRLLEVIRSDAFKSGVDALGGYCTDETGTRIEG